MIHIGILYTEESEETCRLYAPLDVDGAKHLLWFETDIQYAPYLCTERADGIFSILLYYAMLHGHDMVFDTPLTETFYYNMQYYMQLYFYNNDKAFQPVSVSCTLAPSLPSAGAVATGISCGVDSLSTIHVHTADDCPPAFRLTHLTFFNAGSACGDDGVEVCETNGISVNLTRMQNARRYAEDIKLPFIYMNSNVNTFLQINFSLTHTFRNCGFALLLQKLIKTYYYSSAGFLNTFDPANPHLTCGHYDHLTLPMLSNGTMTFYSGLAPYTRYQKTVMLVDDPYAHRHLSVCFHSGKNCGVCSKCVRTLTTLDVLRKTDLFAEVFDLDAYAKYRPLAFARILAEPRAQYNTEILRLMRTNGVKMPRGTIWRLPHAYWILLRYKISCLPDRIAPATRKRIKRFLGMEKRAL